MILRISYVWKIKEVSCLLKSVDIHTCCYMHGWCKCDCPYTRNQMSEANRSVVFFLVWIFLGVWIFFSHIKTFWELSLPIITSIYSLWSDVRERKEQGTIFPSRSHSQWPTSSTQALLPNSTLSCELINRLTHWWVIPPPSLSTWGLLRYKPTTCMREVEGRKTGASLIHREKSFKSKVVRSLFIQDSLGQKSYFPGI